MQAQIVRGGYINLVGPITERGRSITITPPSFKIDIDIAQMDSDHFREDVLDAITTAMDSWVVGELRRFHDNR